MFNFGRQADLPN